MQIIQSAGFGVIQYAERIPVRLNIHHWKNINHTNHKNIIKMSMQTRMVQTQHSQETGPWGPRADIKIDVRSQIVLLNIF